MQLSEAFDAVRGNKLPEKSLGELNEMLTLCHNSLSNRYYTEQCFDAISRIQTEISRREQDKRQMDILAGQKAVNDSLEKVQSAVKQAAKPNAVAIFTLVISAIAAVASVIGYWAQIVDFFRYLTGAH